MPLFNDAICHKPDQIGYKIVKIVKKSNSNQICSSIQFYILLSPYICFIFFLYLDLYVLGDDAWISKGISCKPNIYVS